MKFLNKALPLAVLLVLGAAPQGHAQSGYSHHETASNVQTAPAAPELSSTVIGTGVTLAIGAAALLRRRRKGAI